MVAALIEYLAAASPGDSQALRIQTTRVTAGTLWKKPYSKSESARSDKKQLIDRTRHKKSMSGIAFVLGSAARRDLRGLGLHFHCATNHASCKNAGNSRLAHFVRPAPFERCVPSG